MSMSSTLTITKTGPIATGTYFRNIKPALLKSADRVGKIAQEAAQQDYMSKRKTDKTPSFIFDSFSYSALSSNNYAVTATVFAGGPSAPYTKYVDKGHALRNSTWWPGYHFMSAGLKAGNEVMTSITVEELQKINNGGGSIIKMYKF